MRFTRKQIVIPKIPSGGIGNRLFTYNFAIQFASRIQAELVFPNDNLGGIIDLSKVSNSEKRISLKVPMKSDYLEELTRVASSRWTSIVINKSYLGDYFFQVTDLNPFLAFACPTLLIPENSCDHDDKAVKISLHFRGLDFENWNKYAVMSSGYYLDAIETISIKEPNREICICIVTDDPSHPTILEISNALNLNICTTLTGTAKDAFLNMVHSEYLISSPSTFAIWAGIFSKNSRIIHSKDWLERQASLGDIFWTNLLTSNGNDFYRLWMAI